MSGALERLGRFAARRPWVVIATWAAVCLVVLTAAASFGRELDDPFEAPGLDSQRATELLTRAGAGDMGLGADVVLTPRDPSENLFDSPRARADVARVQEAVAALPHVLGTSDPAGVLDAGRQSAVDSGVVSPDGEVALIRIQYPGRADLSPADLEHLKTTLDDLRDRDVPAHRGRRRPVLRVRAGADRCRRSPRPGGRDRDPAAGLRVHRGHGVADRDGPARPRGRRRVVVRGGLPRRHPQLGGRHRIHDRTRRRHRLRAVHPDPFP